MNELIRREEKLNFDTSNITLNNKQNEKSILIYKPKFKTAEKLSTLNSSVNNRSKEKNEL
jgi:hypothetical protein